MLDRVNNRLEIEAIEADSNQIIKLVSQLNKPFNHDSWNPETMQIEKNVKSFTKPIFSFWNIVRPTDRDTYFGPQPEVGFDTDYWFDWNFRNWGTATDAAIQDDEENPDTTMEQGDGFVQYNFKTTGSPPINAISKLSEQYPDLVFTLYYEYLVEACEGGDCEFMAGKTVSEHTYKTKCRACESEDTLEYSEENREYLCSECGTGTGGFSAEDS